MAACSPSDAARPRWDRRLGAAFGLCVRSELELPGLDGAGPAPARPHVVIRLAAEAEVRGRFSGSRASVRTLHTGDGAIDVHPGRRGDVLLDAGALATIHISRGGAQLTCAAAVATAAPFQRLLLDTALGTAALQRGLEGLHAAAVLLDGRLVAIAGATGAGKSTLAAALVERGATPFTDDLLFVDPGDGALLAHPGPRVMSLPLPGAPLIGRTLAVLGEERWTLLEGPAPPPAELAAVVLIDRRPGAGPALWRRAPSAAGLLALGLDSGGAPSRRQRRFELLARLGASVPVLVVSAEPTESADTLASLVATAAAERSR